MTRIVWVVILGLILLLGIPAAIMKKSKKTKPQQEVARAVVVPTEKVRRVIVPPCGTGVPVANRSPESLAKTAGSAVFVLNKDRGDRIVVIPRCRASHTGLPSEGVNLPAAAFVLPIGANIDAGRAGSVEAGTERVQSQLLIPANSTIRDVVVTGCIESKQQAEKTASGRQILAKAQPGRPTEALAPPC